VFLLRRGVTTSPASGVELLTVVDRRGVPTGVKSEAGGDRRSSATSPGRFYCRIELSEVLDRRGHFGHCGFVHLLGHRGPKQIHIGKGAPMIAFGGTKF
jgi:hypothetical protein